MTLILIAMNIAVFLAGKYMELETRERSMEFYWSSSLPSIELPRYVQVMQQRNANYKFEKIMQLCRNLEHNPRERRLLERLYDHMSADKPFIDQLRAGAVVTPAEDEFPAWRQSRLAFDRLSANAADYNFGFIPASVHPPTAISYLFIHEGIGDLAVNMLFLFLIGVAIERTLGVIAYLFCYLTAGAGVACAFWLIAPDAATPLIGASGAIAGLIGMHAGVFGGRKIRFYWNALFYFDYIRAPALLLLPLWFIGEYYQLHGAANGLIAFIAHIAGLSIGALAAGAIYLFFPMLLDRVYLDEADHLEHRQRKFQRALQYLGELDIVNAYRLLAELNNEYPNDEEIFLHFYRVSRYYPLDGGHLGLIEIILGAPDFEQRGIRLLLEVFADYCRQQPKFEMSADLLIKLSARFYESGYKQEYEKAMHYLPINAYLKDNSH